MKVSTLASALLVSAVAFSSPMVHADKKIDNSGQMTQILEKLHNEGYNTITKIEFDSGKNSYNAWVITADGKKAKIHLNGQNGSITRDTAAETQGLSALEVAKKVQAAGFSSIYKIDTEFFGDGYDVKVLNKEGKLIELNVNAKTGEITED